MEEGLDEQHDRHAKVAAGLRAGLTAMGLELATDPDYQLNPITVVNAPEGVNEGEVRARLLNDFNIEVSGGLGEFRGRVWRVGMMGNGARESSRAVPPVRPGSHPRGHGLRGRLRGQRSGGSTQLCQPRGLIEPQSFYRQQLGGAQSAPNGFSTIIG